MYKIYEVNCTDVLINTYIWTTYSCFFSIVEDGDFGQGEPLAGHQLYENRPCGKCY